MRLDMFIGPRQYQEIHTGFLLKKVYRINTDEKLYIGSRDAGSPRRSY